MVLKTHIEKSVPGITVIISQPIERHDDNAIACLIVRRVIEKLNNLEVRIMKNDNIKREHLGKQGLHINDYGTARYAMNLISLIKRL